MATYIDLLTTLFIKPDTFLEDFNSTLSEFHFNRQNTYFCGDYNIDLLKVKRFQLNEAYFDSILTAGYIPTITLPTRLLENNFSNNGKKAFILNIHISDHQPITLFTNDQTPATKTHFITVAAITVILFCNYILKMYLVSQHSTEAPLDHQHSLFNRWRFTHFC